MAHSVAGALTISFSSATTALTSFAVLRTSGDPNADPNAYPTWLADTNRYGWALMMAALGGISELSQCLILYRGIGVHFWYDFWLRCPDFRPPDFPGQSRCQQEDELGERS